MEELAKSKNTPGTDAAFDLLGRVAVDPDSDERYPSGTILIPADSPDASKLMSHAIDERKPMAIVFPDGSDVVARPPPLPALPYSSCSASCGWPTTFGASATGRRSCRASG
jgi:hypothetical protein